MLKKQEAEPFKEPLPNFTPSLASAGHAGQKLAEMCPYPERCPSTPRAEPSPIGIVAEKTREGNGKEWLIQLLPSASTQSTPKSDEKLQAIFGGTAAKGR